MGGALGKKSARTHVRTRAIAMNNMSSVRDNEHQDIYKSLLVISVLL